MTSSVDSSAIGRRKVGSRRDVMTFTVGRRAFRIGALLGVLVLALVFGGGFWVGQSVDIGSRTRALTTRVVQEHASTGAPKTTRSPKKSAKPVAPVPAVPPTTNKVPPTTNEVPVAAAPPFELETKGLPKDGFGLQLGAFESEDEARRFASANAEVLVKQEAYLMTTEVKGKGIWYRVRIGRFETKRAARRFRKELSRDLRDAAIVVTYR